MFKKLLFTVSTRLLGKVTVVLELFFEPQRFNQNSAGADVVMRTKVTLAKNFGMNTIME